MSEALPPHIKEALLNAFTALDKSGSMQLEVKDIGRLMNTMFSSQMDDMQLAEIMSEICDSDAPGVAIDFESFCKAMGPVLTSLSDEEVTKRAFAAMDADGSGCISATELAPLMSTVSGTRMREQQVKDVLALTAQKDGKVRYDDYAKAVAP